MGAQRYIAMAAHVRGKPLADWPAWSVGETLIVALLLNDAATLNAMRWTVLEAMDRVDLDARELRALERQLQDGAVV